jgi:hypothetical protein
MGWVVKATPRPLHPWERPGTLCIGGWKGPRAGLDGCGKFRPKSGFDPRTVQPIVSRYTDWAVRAQVFILIREYNMNATNAIPITAEPVYNDIGLCYTSYIKPDILLCSPQYHPRLKGHSFKGIQNIPFHDVITEFQGILNQIKSECSTTDLRFWRW